MATLKANSRTWTVALGAFLCLVLGMTSLLLVGEASIRANPGERTRKLPGDDLIANPIGSVTHAITIRSSSRDVWPWLVQMGAGRAGWYSYDFAVSSSWLGSPRGARSYHNLGACT